MVRNITLETIRGVAFVEPETGKHRDVIAEAARLAGWDMAICDEVDTAVRSIDDSTAAVVIDGLGTERWFNQLAAGPVLQTTLEFKIPRAIMGNHPYARHIVGGRDLYVPLEAEGMPAAEKTKSLASWLVDITTNTRIA